MNSNYHDQLCQFEQQKPKYQHLYLGLYQSQLFQIHGPKLKQSETLKCKQNQGEQQNSQDPIYLDIQQNQEQEIKSQSKIFEEQQIQLKNNTIFKVEKKYRVIQRFGMSRIIRNKYQEDIESLENNDNPSLTSKGYKECQICFSFRQVHQFLSCQHEFCRDCISEYLKENILAGNALVILCPNLFCKEEFGDLQIKEIVSQNLYEKYQRFYFRQLISINKNVRWCPRIDCENYVIWQGVDLLTCVCGQQICFKCGNQYHQDISCEQAMDTQYLQARKELQINNCPNCSAPIEKEGGCNHMICYKCKYEFCWICRGKYSSAHYTILNIFGCAIPGGQVMRIKPLKNPILIRIMIAIAKLLFALVFTGGLLFSLPFILLFHILQAPYKIVQEKSNFRIQNYSKFAQFGFFQLFLFIGIILSPITIICTILISPVLLINYIIESF
ncbi:unnamed protein product [Paramecium pentaurelia]|uniref:RBR-type E3 ubiquitin transferase n=1 Tax=Paramecium pentaurelia TaxID=43138 RepID=A0A8S1Y494_9CILI|nr:unnamed protein product [Paramecium pentaurelia]